MEESSVCVLPSIGRKVIDVLVSRNKQQHFNCVFSGKAEDCFVIALAYESIGFNPEGSAMDLPFIVGENRVVNVYVDYPSRKAFLCCERFGFDPDPKNGYLPETATKIVNCMMAGKTSRPLVVDRRSGGCWITGSIDLIPMAVKELWDLCHP